MKAIMKDMARIVVWGGTGFVGRHLVDCLKEEHQIQVIVRSFSRVPFTWEQDRHIAVCEETEVDKLEQADIMYYLAWGGTSGDLRGDLDLQLDNIRRTCDAVRVAAKLHCHKFVYTGSIMEYEVIEAMNSDGNVPGMNCIYSVSKLAADYYARILANNMGIGYCNALISNTFGPEETSQRFIVTMCNKLIKHEDIALTEGTQLYDFIYITDAAEALKSIGMKGKNNHTYYIGNREQRSLRRYVEQMKEVLQSNSDLQFGAVGFSGIELSYKEFDTYKLYDELGFECKVDFEEGIRKTANWLKEVGRIEDL